MNETEIYEKLMRGVETRVKVKEKIKNISPESLINKINGFENELDEGYNEFIGPCLQEYCSVQERLEKVQEEINQGSGDCEEYRDIENKIEGSFGGLPWEPEDIKQIADEDAKAYNDAIKENVDSEILERITNQVDVWESMKDLVKENPGELEKRLDQALEEERGLLVEIEESIDPIYKKQVEIVRNLEEAGYIENILEDADKTYNTRAYTKESKAIKYHEGLLDLNVLEQKMYNNGNRRGSVLDDDDYKIADRINDMTIDDINDWKVKINRAMESEEKSYLEPTEALQETVNAYVNEILGGKDRKGAKEKLRVAYTDIRECTSKGHGNGIPWQIVQDI